jgi:hypothetical protein
MARQIKIGEIGDYAERQLNLLIKAAVLTADSRLKLQSPVVKMQRRLKASQKVNTQAIHRQML